MADQDRQLEDPLNLTWDYLERRGLTDPVIAVYITHARAGNLSREAAAIGMALTLSRMNAARQAGELERLRNEPPGFGQVRSFLQSCIDFAGSKESAREHARQALVLLDELTQRREQAVTGA